MCNTFSKKYANNVLISSVALNIIPDLIGDLSQLRQSETSLSPLEHLLAGVRWLHPPKSAPEASSPLPNSVVRHIVWFHLGEVGRERATWAYAGPSFRVFARAKIPLNFF